jgi:hypothetical protein
VVRESQEAAFASVLAASQLSSRPRTFSVTLPTWLSPGDVASWPAAILIPTAAHRPAYCVSKEPSARGRELRHSRPGIGGFMAGVNGVM